MKKEMTLKILSIVLTLVIVFVSYTALPVKALAEDEIHYKSSFYEESKQDASFNDSDDSLFIRKRIRISDKPPFYVPIDLDSRGETASLFAFSDETGTLNYRVFGQYLDIEGFFACNEIGDYVDTEGGPLYETDDIDVSSVFYNCGLDDSSSVIDDSPSNPDLTKDCNNTSEQNIDDESPSNGFNYKSEFDSEVLQHANTIKCMSMEEYEKLLAVQPAPSMEYVESCIVQTEDSDGNGIIEAYFAPIKYKDSNGVWKRINPAIRTIETGDDRTYESNQSSTKITFHSENRNATLVSIEQDGYAIQLSPIIQERIIASKEYEMDLLSDSDSRFSRDAGDQTPSKDEYARIRYRDVYADNIDIVFTPTGNGLKEEVVFYEVPEQQSFSFLLSLNGLTPLLREDGNVYLIEEKTQQIISVIPTPVMYDASGNEDDFSYSIDVTIALLEDGMYIYTLTPDESWLRDKERTYPVVLDPTVTYTGATYIADTHVTNGNKNKNYHSETGLKFGRMANGNILRDYFDFTSIISYLTQNPVQVTSATLTCYEEYSGNSTPTVNLHQVTSALNITTVTWNSQPSFDSTAFSSTVVKNVGSYSWDMTSKVQNWVSNSNVLRKIVMKSSNESQNKYKRFTSTEGSTAANRPKLVITYSTAPNAPTQPSISWNRNGTKANIIGSWTAVSGATSYNVRLYKNNSLQTTVNTTARTYTFSNQSDNATYKISVSAKNSIGSSAWATSSTVTVGDLTPPTAPSSVSVSPTEWTNGNVIVTHTASTDASSVTYEYALSASNSTAPTSFSTLPSPSALSHTLTTPPVGTWYVWIRGKDAAGNAGTAKCSATPYKRNTTPPAITGPEIVSCVGDVVQVRATITTDANDFGSWTLTYHLGTGSATQPVTIATGTSTINNSIIACWNVSELANNSVYTLTLSATDQAGNNVSQSTTWTKAEGSREIPALLSHEITIDESDNWVANFEKVSADDPSSYSNAHLIVDNEYQQALIYSIPNTCPEDVIKYAYVVAMDQGGQPAYSYTTYEKQQLYIPTESSSGITLDGVTIDNGSAQLLGTTGTVLTSTDELPGTVSYVDLIVNQNVPSGASIEYELSTDGGTTWQAITPITTDGGITLNNSNRLYLFGSDTGSSIRIKATLNKGTAASSPIIHQLYTATRYLFFGSGEIIETVFEENARGFTQLQNTAIVDSSLTLIDATAQGSVQSTQRIISGEAIATRLIVDTTIPTGAAIDFLLSTDGGNNWEPINPIPANDQNTWNPILNRGANIKLKAVLSASNIDNPPILRSWALEIKADMPGVGEAVSLIDPPSNLSAFTGVNNMTLLRWAPSQTTGVTYNIYRSETPYFTISPETCIASNITDCNWSDYNLNYGRTYYYLVSAVKNNRISTPSNQAVGTSVDANELEKHLGLQDYWSFAQFSTDSGAGYINVSNGNLVYQSTDLVISDPFFAMVMRRTFNSQAMSKTALGKGWDFSFNTTLIREYDANGEETGMILKDGDGSLHRFARYENGTYASAPGTRMVLAHDTTNHEYTITRKDNVTYHFDDQSMRLFSFTNLAGASLTYSYDDRGNVSEITNSVGDKLTFTYKVQRKVEGIRSEPIYQEVYPNETDYLYVNDHVDMLVSVEWVSTENSNARILYTYEYDNQDRLISASTSLDGNTNYTESFSYENDCLKTITNPDGREYLLTMDEANRLTAISYPGGAEATLLNYNIGSTVVKTKIGNDDAYTVATYIYSESGTVTKLTDAGGHDINYTYTLDLLPASVSYTNYVNGQLSSTPITQTYEYDASTRNLTRLVVMQGSTTLSETLYQNYVYNQPQTVKVLTSEGYRTTTYTYNTAGQVLTVTDPAGKQTVNGYNSIGYLISTTDRNGGYIGYAYDVKGRVVTVSSSNGANETPFSVVRYTYDTFGRTHTVKTDGMEDTVTYQYDIRGLLIRKDYANGAYEAYTYSTAGLTLTARNVEGVTTSYAYDAMGRTTSANRGGAVTSYAYLGSDDNGVRRIEVTDPEGRTTTSWYNENGWETQQTTGGVTTQFRHDLMGRQTAVIVLGASTAQNRIIRAEYDAMGNQTLTARVHSDNFDKIGSHGERLSGYTVSKDLTTSNSYDILGNVISATDGRGTTVTYGYDELNRLTQVSQPLSSGVTAITTYAYDITVSGGVSNTTTAANGVVSTSFFDRSGRKTRETVKNPNNSSESVNTSYTYDAHGQVTSVTRNDGSIIRYEYDQVGNVTREEYYASGAATAEMVTVYAYSEAGGYLTSVSQTMSGNTITTAYSYDSIGRVIQQRQETGTNEGCLIVNYQYNDADQIVSIAYAKENNQGINNPNNTTLRILWYTYDNEGRISEIWLDEGNCNTTSMTTNAKLIRTYYYLTTGEIDRIVDNTAFLSGGSLTTELKYTYNTFGLPIKLTYTDVNGNIRTVREETSLTYDKNGNILTENTTEAYSGSVTKTKQYAYDLGNRLISATMGGTTTTYGYDLVGNRTSRKKGSEAQENYTYNYLNQLTQVQQGSTSTSYSYDDRGNQIQEVYTVSGQSATTTYSYDLANRMTSLNRTSGNVTLLNSSFGYNALNQRVTRVENEVITHFYYTGGALLFSTENEYLLKTQNILDPSGGIVASKRFEGQEQMGQDPFANEYFFYRYDVRGSVTSIVDGTGTRIKGYDYDEFGNATASNSTFYNEVTFTGSISDASGLQYMNARYYNPKTARFMSQDTYTGVASTPWTQHLYSYCNNNPVNMVDPTGHRPCRAVLMADAGSSRSKQSAEEIWETRDGTTIRTHNGIVEIDNGDYGEVYIPYPNGTPSFSRDRIMIAVAEHNGAQGFVETMLRSIAGEIGTPYPPRDEKGNHPRKPNTLDCSELVYKAVSTFDDQFYNTTRGQIHSLRRDKVDEFIPAKKEWSLVETEDINLSTLIPGDLIYWTKDGTRPCHVGIYCGSGYMIDSTESGGGVAFRRVSDFTAHDSNSDKYYLGYARYTPQGN